MANILLIEPDILLARTYRTALEAHGYVVDICPSAQSAASCADMVKPDLVIMELQLVNHSGVEFLYEFRSYIDWQDIPVVVLTHVPAGEFAGCRHLFWNELRVNAYLYKPYTSLKKLLSTVQELTAVSRSVNV
jgi:DNA-binding response OmpR family regulator